MIEAVLAGVAAVVVLMLVVPWIAIGMEAYWGWCLRVQRKVRASSAASSKGSEK